MSRKNPDLLDVLIVCGATLSSLVAALLINWVLADHVIHPERWNNYNKNDCEQKK